VKFDQRSLQFALLTTVAVAALYARTAVSPLQESMRVTLALSDNQLAMLQGPALAIAPVAAAVPLGLLVDRFSRVRILFISLLANVLGTLATAAAPTFAALFAARCLIGLAHTATSTAAFSLLSDLYGPTQRGRASMAIVIGQFAGMAAAFALGGILAAKFSSPTSSWRIAMMWLAAPLVPVLFTTLGMREPPRGGVVVRAASVRESFAELWSERALLVPLLTGMLMIEVADCAVLVWAAPALARNFALAPDRVGEIMSSVVLTSGVLGSVTGGVLADWCQRVGGPRTAIGVLGLLALLSAPAALFAITTRFASASLLLLVFLLLAGAIIVMAVALLTIVVRSELRGLCLAAMIGANTLFGVALAPLMVSLLSGAIGGPTAIGRAMAWVCATAGLLGAAAFSLGRQYFPRTVTA